MSETKLVFWNKGIKSWQFPFIERGTEKRKTKAVPRAAAKSERDYKAAFDWATKALAFYKKSPRGTWPGKVLAAPHEKRTIKTLKDWWLKHRQGIVDEGKGSWATLEQFKCDLRVHVIPDAIADVDLEHDDELSFKLMDFFEGMAARVTKGDFGPSTGQKVAVTITALLNDAIAKRQIKVPGNMNPMDSAIVRGTVPKRAPRGKDDVIVHVPIDDFRKLVSSPKVASHAIVRYVIEATTGAREGEVAGWVFSDFKPDDPIPSFQIDRQLNVKRKLVPPKKGSYRTLPLHPAAVEAFKWWQAEGWEKWVGRKPLETDPVFPDQRGNAYRPQTARTLRVDLLKANLSDQYQGHDIDAHGLRRTFGTVIGDAGIPLEIREVLMGHGSKNVTDRHYTARNLPKFAPHMGVFPLDPAVLALPKHEPVFAAAAE